MPMKTILLAGVLLLIGYTGFCQPDSLVINAVKAIEYRRFAAQVAKDTALLNSILAADLIYTHSNGNVDTKQSFIQAIREEKIVYEKIEPEALNLRVYTNNETVVGNGKVLITMPPVNNKPVLLHLRYAVVYIKQNEGWQLVMWQSTRLPQQ